MGIKRKSPKSELYFHYWFQDGRKKKRRNESDCGELCPTPLRNTNGLLGLNCHGESFL